jgi:hypothetical protein
MSEQKTKLNEQSYLMVARNEPNEQPVSNAEQNEKVTLRSVS